MADTLTSPDKFKHFTVCLLLSLVGAYGMAFAIGGSLCKEWMDSKSKGNHWCWLDLLFDLLGCAGGMGIHWLIFKSINL